MRTCATTNARRAGCALILAGLLSAAVQAAPSISTPSVTPSRLVALQATTVTASCQVNLSANGSPPIGGGVDLVRLASNGTAESVIGVMRDDGLNGDAKAGDSIYTLRFSDNEPTAGQFGLQCTAAFKGLLDRVRSPAVTITVVSGSGSGSISAPTISPSTIPLGTSTRVTITAVVSGASPQAGSVMLQRLDSAGRVVAVLGALHDDGLNGDQKANDGIYTLQATFDEFAAGPISLRVAATFSGAANHVFSPIGTLTVTGAPPPTITITSPAKLAYLNLAPTTVTGRASDPKATISINSIQTPNANGAFSASIPLLEGPNIITVTATSPSGAVGTASEEVTLDTTPPHVTITSPTNQFVTSQASISVTGNVNDIVVGTVNSLEAKVTVDGIASQVANRTFLAKNVPLKMGSNTIQAVAVDRAGNSETTQITVVRQAPQPGQIQVVSGNNQTGTIGTALTQPLTIGLIDTSGKPAVNKQVLFSVTQNDGLLRFGNSAPAPSVLATTNAQGQASVAWTLGMRSGAGSDGIQAYSVGFGGTAVFTASASQGRPGLIVVDSGNNQTGAVNEALPKPLIAVVVDAGHNRLKGVPVTFSVVKGGGNFGGQTSLTVTTDPDGRVAATLTLGLQEGSSNNVVTANFPGNSSFPASFTASGRGPGDPSKTVISGVVLDNSDQPIPGVTVRAALTNVAASNPNFAQTVQPVQTDAKGNFSIYKAPVGFVKVFVDGSTASKTSSFPSLEYDLVTVAGQINTVGQPIYLLPIKTDNKLCVTDTTGGGTITIPEAPGFSLTFAPRQVTFPGGTKTGCVSVTIVHPDKVPMVPGFGQQPRFIVTIQPSGAMFNPPAAMTLPNVDGLRPREVTEMYSYDHDINSFVAIGTGTVSDDGQVIRTNPGIGVLKAGWHCGGNPNVAGTAATCGPCASCDGTSCQTDPAKAGKPCQSACIVGGAGTCNNGHCTGTLKPPGSSCGNGGACDQNGNCVFGNGPGGCPGGCNSGNPCITDSCSAGQCVATANQLCQQSCSGLAAGASCTVGNLSGTCDSGGNCNLCGVLGVGASCTCSGGTLGTCDSTGQCSCCHLAIQDLGPIFTGSLQLAASSRTRSPVSGQFSAVASCSIGTGIPVIVIGPGRAEEVGPTVCSGANCPTNLQWETDDPAVAFIGNGTCLGSASNAHRNNTLGGNSAIICPGPTASVGMTTLVHLKDQDGVDRARAEVKVGGKVSIKVKAKCGTGYSGIIQLGGSIGATPIVGLGDINGALSTSAITVAEVSGMPGEPVSVLGDWLETRPRAGRRAKASCQTTVPSSGENDCELEFDIDCSSPTIQTTLAPAPRNNDPEGNLWINAQDLAAPNRPNEITQVFSCSDPDDTPLQSDVETCGPDSASKGLSPPVHTPAINGRGQTFHTFASDLVGNTNSQDQTVNVDTMPPTVQLANIVPQPNSSGWNNSPSVTVTFTAQDQSNLSGIVSALSRTVLDGITSHGLTRLVGGDGIYNVAAFAADYAGNQGTAGATVKIDTIPPIILITSPSNGASVSTLTATVAGTVTDNGSGVDPNHVRCNNGAILSNASITGNSFICSVALFNPSTTITVQAADVAGNLGTSPPVTVNYTPTSTQ